MYVAHTSTAAAGPANATTVSPASVDKELVERIAAGDQSAMRVLFLRHQVKVYRFVLQIVKQPAMADELITDVFLDVWRSSARFEGRSSVVTWVLSIARHKALSAVRGRRLRQCDLDVAAGVEDPADSPEVVVLKKECGAELRRCLTMLSPEHREVIDLVYYHQRSVAEVADILDIPAATIKTRMFYARQDLAKRLRAAGVERVSV